MSLPNTNLVPELEGLKAQLRCSFRQSAFRKMRAAYTCKVGLVPAFSLPARLLLDADAPGAAKQCLHFLLPCLLVRAKNLLCIL